MVDDVKRLENQDIGGDTHRFVSVVGLNGRSGAIFLESFLGENEAISFERAHSNCLLLSDEWEVGVGGKYLALTEPAAVPVAEDGEDGDDADSFFDGGSKKCAAPAVAVAAPADAQAAPSAKDKDSSSSSSEDENDSAGDKDERK